MTSILHRLAALLRRLRDYFRTRHRTLTPTEVQLRTRVKELTHERAERDRRIQALKLDAEALRSEKQVLEREVELLAAVNARNLLRAKAEAADFTGEKA